MFASNGEWAFDFNGWTLEKELLQEYTQAYKEKFEGWEYDRVVVPLDWKRYAYLPWERAYNYIKQFPSEPPKGA